MYVTYDKAGKLEVTAGLTGLQVLKSTQSGYTGFLRVGAAAPQPDSLACWPPKARGS